MSAVRDTCERVERILCKARKQRGGGRLYSRSPSNFTKATLTYILSRDFVGKYILCFKMPASASLDDLLSHCVQTTSELSGYEMSKSRAYHFLLYDNEPVVEPLDFLVIQPNLPVKIL